MNKNQEKVRQSRGRLYLFSNLHFTITSVFLLNRYVRMCLCVCMHVYVYVCVCSVFKDSVIKINQSIKHLSIVWYLVFTNEV